MNIETILIGFGLLFNLVTAFVSLSTRLAVAELKAEQAEKCTKCEDRFVSRRELPLFQTGATHGQS